MKLLFLFTFSLPLQAWAAACCGGGLTAPSIILGEDSAQMSVSYSNQAVVSDVDAESLWHHRQDPETTETYTLNVAHIFWDRWQAGLGLPIVKRSLGDESSSGLGDVAGTLGYEYLPEWEYSSWRPKGIGFVQLTAPTGRSNMDSDQTFQLDVRGRGFWTLGVGTLLTKIISRWDLFTSLDVHRSFSHSYSDDQFTGTLIPGYGGDLGVGAGYNVGPYRFGGSITWTYEDPIDMEGTINSQGSAQRYATTALSLSYLLPEEWSVTGSYADQTWFGSPTNASLGRGLLITAQKRWLR